MASASRPLRIETPFHLTIRFTNSVSDLDLDIPSPSRTTVVQLKRIIRSSLPAEYCENRLRLIYAGRMLTDNSILTLHLKSPPSPPPPPSDSKGKGKAPEPVPPRIYINCSIGDTLTHQELQREDEAAAGGSQNPISTSTDIPSQQPAQTTPQPRGFDRLLTSSFTTAEVSALRSQFLSIQASMHTPDTMPSPTTLRRMEDAWLDDNGTGGDEARAEAESGALDDFLWGNVMGFLWPLGALGWMGREEGVWSDRKRMAVWTGVALGVTFGVVRMISG